MLEVDRRRRAVVLEPGAHRPGLAEAPQVLLHRLLLDRGRIVRPRLVHVAEIDLLASGGEGLGKVGHLVEEPVPAGAGARVVEGHEHVVGRRDIEQHEVRQEGGVIEREAVGDASAAVVADEDDGAQTERPDDVGNVGRHRPLVVARGGTVGVAVAAQVGGQNAEPLGERRHDLAPHVSRLRVAVEEDHATPRAHPSVVDPHAVTHLDDASDHR